MNGDGYVDIIVGAYGNSDARSNAGKAHVYLGSASGLNTTASWTATCNASYDYFGSSVASAGDVNGDGYYDVIVGAPDNDTGGNNAGKSYVYLGSASGLSTTASWTAIGEVSADRFGSSVASAGDVNDDGYGDVIVGAYGNNDGGNNAGKSYVYLGSASGLSTTASWTAAGDAAYDYFGSSVASAGDLDGDGYGDIIVGAYRNNYGGSDAGKVYTYQNLDLWTLEVVKWTAAGDAAGDYFGSSVTSAGDVNGDGYRDVVVGAPEHDSGGSDAGKAYVYLGSASGLSTTAQWTATGDAAGDYFGSSVASAGDVNGDGYGDIVVSAPNNNDNGNDAGKAYVYLGSATGLSTTASWTETGARVVDYFGSSVSSAGDVNGDGYGDVIVGAQYNDDGGKNVGKAYVYLGSASGLSKMVQWTAIGEDLYDRFGESVAPAGDVNDDGYDDVIVGAPYNDDGGNNAGKSYVYLGSASGLGTIASWAEIGDAAKDYFGATVASAGDVDGDGYGDVIVSAHGNDDGSNDAGKAYVYLGSATGLSTTASWTETGEVAGDYFGSSVASAGDVDGDGYDDVIVSAHGNNDGSNDAGKVYVYGGIGYCEHGLFVSEKFGMSDSTIVKWIDISWNPAVQPYGTDARFQIGTSNDGKSFVYIGPDGTANTYYTDPAGQTIYSEQVGKVWRYKALLYSDERRVQTPTITDVSIVYEESPYTAPAVDVTSPNGEEVLIGGKETQIEWISSGNLGATPISIYYSTDNGGNWTAIAEGIDDTGIYVWAVPSVETEVALVKAVVTDIIDNTDSDISDTTFVIGLETDSINLFAGWNFVSTPIKLKHSDDTVQQVFDGVDTGDNPIYLYDGGVWNLMGGSDIVMALDGIWIYSTDAAAVSLNFDTGPVPTPPTKNLGASWNAIGHSSTVPVPASQTLSSVESEWTSLIGFDASDQSYNPEIINDDATGSSHDERTPMYPTKGYWLHMTDAGELEGLSAGDVAPTPPATRPPSTSGVPQLPEAYYGTVAINGILAPEGTEIIAMISGIEKGRFTTTTSGIYGNSGTFDSKLIVAGDEPDVGGTITFWLDGMLANQTDTYNCGTITNLFLSVGKGRMRGDLDCDYALTAIDAAIALEIAVGSRPFDDFADVNRDGKVGAIDAFMIMQAAAGVISF